MPHKFNASRRHKIAKKKYRVTNWGAYNESLRNRGDLTIWNSSDVQNQRVAPRRESRGGQPRYSDLAITMCPTLGVVYKPPLRQTQGLMRSISTLMQLEVPVPDFSTLSRRGCGLCLPASPKIKRTEPDHLVVDSTGLKIFGEGEWLQKKHNAGAKRKKWRNLHLGLNFATGEIICTDLTLDNVGDATVLPGLLDQINEAASWFVADGAYDGAPTSELLQERFGKRSRLPSRHHEMRSQARNPPLNFHFEIDTLLKYKPMAAWPGNLAAAIISAAELRHKSGVGKRSSGQN